MERDTYHSEHFCCVRKILRLPHADGFAQFQDTLLFIRLKSWLVVAVRNFEKLCVVPCVDSGVIGCMESGKWWCAMIVFARVGLFVICVPDFDVLS